MRQTPAGACDCHSHVYGPWDRFPVPEAPTFDPPCSSIEALEATWQDLGIERAVLVQGAAYGKDHRAMLHALGCDPERRRGVALLNHEMTDQELIALDAAGVRAVRFHWVEHLRRRSPRTAQEEIDAANRLLARVHALGWHGELHLDPIQLEWIDRLVLPRGMPLVIDHMARLEVGVSHAPRLPELLKLLQRESIWVKLSGSDRLTARSESLSVAAPSLRAILDVAPERAVWGLDWPHVNLDRKRSDSELIGLLLAVVRDEEELRQVLVENPERLYGFHPIDRHAQ